MTIINIFFKAGDAEMLQVRSRLISIPVALLVMLTVNSQQSTVNA
ncbi:MULTISPECIES: hypothetical protein [unclassified Tychonema]|nr:MULTISPECIES: hypothetical protein [unclassified Tychonema]